MTTTLITQDLEPLVGRIRFHQRHPESDQIRIAVDVDNTLCNAIPILNRLLQLRSGLDVYPSVQDGTFETELREVAWMMRDVLAAYHAGYMDLAARKQSTQAALNYLNQRYRIIVVSARPESATEGTRRWLKQQGLFFDELICCGDPREKVNVIRDRQCELAIEDQPRVALDLTPLTPTFLIQDGCPWNTYENLAAHGWLIPGIHLTQDWFTLLQTIKDIEEAASK